MNLPMRYIDGIAILRPGDRFPDPNRGPADRPVAIGIELTPALMLKGYACGIFPWSVSPVTWWSPDPRAIFELDGLYISRRLARTIRKNQFQIRFDTAFHQVITECAQPRSEQNGVWITDEFMDAYMQLFRAGYAHSVECWQGDELVGGIFGVAVGGFFAGESMFHRVSDASKIALHFLIERLRVCGFKLFDIQVITDHTHRMGAVEISRSEYLSRLREAINHTPRPFLNEE